MSAFYEGLAEIFEIEADTVNPALDLQSLEMDSLAVVSIIALVDECFDVMLNGEAIMRCVTVADIEALIKDSK